MWRGYADRPTSNPLPPGTQAFSKYQNVSSAQQIKLDSVAHEVPNFGTEQDKAHSPFHLKTGACRFGPRCSRVHFYPDKSCTILMKNMYNGPGIAWEQEDEGLETFMDSLQWRCMIMTWAGLVLLFTSFIQIRKLNEEFYEDVHTEFQKYGELVNFKAVPGSPYTCWGRFQGVPVPQPNPVCRNGSFHLKGNVYVHYRSLESSILSYQSINGRYFAGKQTCSRGSACNFIHCFRNPGGDYEWADNDKPPPRFWILKMSALFGYSDEYVKHMEFEYSGSLSDLRSDQPTDSHRQPSRQFRSRDHGHINVGSKPCHRSSKNHRDTRGHKLSRHEEKRHGGDESPRKSMGGIPLMILLMEMTMAGERRVTDGKAQGVMVEEAQIQKLKNGWRMKRDTRTHWSSSDRRAKKEEHREGSSGDQEESHAHDRVVHADKSHPERWKHGHERSSSRFSHEGDSSESILTEAGKEAMP
ncbi:hypothetical protein F2Q70_00019698 [Brassica cretica]|uniref:C3H1-type domain-containing protein n=1 Tax=Brassica cretica TaxID=69181 RepID=A0A8S9GVP3_BRACR|nr:hypothetical protein F2Q70_00019698 [Brassica cretica]